MKKIYNLMYALFFMLVGMHANARIQDVEMADFSFTPSSFNITTGDTIIWKLASGTHSVQTLTVPAGSATFDSPIMSVPGETFMFVPEVIGSYTYQCGVHGSIMSGSFMVMSSVGISKPTLSWLSRAYPNPFSDKLNIDIKGIDQIDVFNLIGKRVKALSTSLADTKIEMDLTNLPAGIYYYNAYKEGKIIETQKIIKAK